MTDTSGFSYKGGSIDDQIVSDAIGGAGANLEAEVLSPRRPVVSSKKRTRQIAALIVLLMVGGSGIMLFKGQGVPVSPDVAKLIARSEDAAAQMAAGTPAPPAPPAAVPAAAAPDPVVPAPVSPVPSPASVSPMDVVAVTPASTVPAVLPAAPASPPVSLPEKPVVVDPAPAQVAAKAALESDLKALEEKVTGKKKELADLDEKIVAAKKTVSSLASAAPKVASTPKETRAQAAPPAKPAVAKQVSVPQQGLNRVFAILGDGVVLMDGDVISVGESSPKIGGILTRVNASANQVEVSGTTRNVLVEQR